MVIVFSEYVFKGLLQRSGGVTGLLLLMLQIFLNKRNQLAYDIYYGLLFFLTLKMRGRGEGDGGERECTQRGQKMTTDPLKLELQVVSSHPIQALGTQLQSSWKAVCALNH